jgi:hypothetical protein
VPNDPFFQSEVTPPQNQSPESNSVSYFGIKPPSSVLAKQKGKWHEIKMKGGITVMAPNGQAQNGLPPIKDLTPSPQGQTTKAKDSQSLTFENGLDKHWTSLPEPTSNEITKTEEAIRKIQAEEAIRKIIRTPAPTPKLDLKDEWSSFFKARYLCLCVCVPYFK